VKNETTLGDKTIPVPPKDTTTQSDKPKRFLEEKKEETKVEKKEEKEEKPKEEKKDKSEDHKKSDKEFVHSSKVKIPDIQKNPLFAEF
jgi:hypothetical protein